MKVLIVDDNDTNRKLLRVTLEAEGLSTKEARDGQHALSLLDSGGIDAVISDILMPRMDGYQLCHAMRKIDRYKHTPFVFYSNTYTSGASEALAREVGANGFIRKPAGVQKVMTVLRESIAEEAANGNAREGAVAGSSSQTDRLKEAHERLLTTNHELLVRTRELEEAQELLIALNTALQNTIEGIGYLETTRRFRTVNSAYARITGFRADEMAGLDWFATIHTDDTEKLNRAFGDMLQAGKTSLEAKGRRKDGTAYYTETILVADFDSQRRLKGFHSFIKDITARREAQEALLNARAQLEQANCDLTHKNREINSFYHTLSHELKTPLTSAREFVSLVVDGTVGPINAQQADHLQMALESCDQLAYCINDLLDATRLETGKLGVYPEPASLADLIERIVAGLGKTTVEKELTLRTELDQDLPQAVIDEHRIGQVLTNLIGNALKFTPAKGEIVLRATESAEQAGFIEVTVSDNGRGMAADQLKHIFDRLYQIKEGDATTEQGMGLGLFLCQELVRLHGGTIGVTSELGRGSKFTFTVPHCRPMPAL